ncbi:MAG: aminodeoxychorismate synthase component I, partial [Bacteroidota bacterium]
ELPEALIPTAWTEDGLLMAAKHRTKTWWGVQYHPESIATASGEQLVKNLLQWVEKEAGQISAPPAPKPLNQLAALQQQVWDLRWETFEWKKTEGELFEQLFGERDAAFWLDSSAGGKDSGRWSCMGAYGLGPQDQLIVHSLKTGDWSAKGMIDLEGPDQLWRYWKAHQAQQKLNSGEVPFPFVGGWVGWMGYEARTLGGVPAHQLGETPDITLWFCTRFVVLDREKGTGYVVALTPEQRPREADRWMTQTQERILSDVPKPISPDTGQLLSPIRLRHEEQAYLQQIAQAQTFIRDGESYEICLTNEWETTYAGDPLHLYHHLRQVNPAPYAAFFRLGDHTILSSSPERFLQMEPDGSMSSKPIKGTLERSEDPLLDEQLRHQLANSEKDQAENLMIVDLLRNDLGKVSEIGSVQVPNLMEIESFASVHQMVSTVQAQLQAGLTPWDVLETAFPGGSITGAPKRRTMELIDQLEQRPRGIYTGSIGYVGLDGRADWNIAIRTISLNGHSLRFGSGGAITHLSDPKAEFREILIKSLPLLRAIQAASGKAPEDWSFLSGIEATDWPELFYPNPVGIS